MRIVKRKLDRDGIIGVDASRTDDTLQFETRTESDDCVKEACNVIYWAWFGSFFLKSYAKRLYNFFFIRGMVLFLRHCL